MLIAHTLFLSFYFIQKQVLERLRGFGKADVGKCVALKRREVG
jgi:hypothetical protein